MSITNKLSEKISKELGYDNEKKEIIAYGLFAFLQIITSLAIVSALGLIFGVVGQAITSSFASSILRQYSGGVHASKPSTCLIIGTFVTMVIATLSHFWLINLNTLYLIIIITLLTVFSYVAVFRNAPVDSKTKPIKSIEKRKRMKKNSLIVLSVYLLFILIMIFIYYFTKQASYLEYSCLICLSFSWQAFTLTKTGHGLLSKADSIINNFSSKKGEKSI